ncbi:MAG: terminase small subunit [Flavobacterium sp.]|jgi:phage terminase small subunit|nr:terminase small subunit [Flavobacterium sp.]
MKQNKLTLKQEAFCQAYIRSGDKSAAYREAYNASRMKPETIHEMASKLSSNHKVATRIKELQSKVAAIAEKKFNITAEEMLRHLNVLRNSRIDEYVEFKKGKLSFKDFEKLTKEQLMCIESIKETRFGIEIKLHGKEWTIEKINKHIGFYEKDNEQKAQVLSPEQRTQRLKELKEKLNNSEIC